MKLIPIELLNKLGAYLATRPYSEVAALINELVALADAPKEESKKEK